MSTTTMTLHSDRPAPFLHQPGVPPRDETAPRVLESRGQAGDRLGHLRDALALLLLVVASANLVTWRWDDPAVREFVPWFSAMKANTAFSLLLASLGLLCLGWQPVLLIGRILAAIFGSIVAVIGLLTLVEYVARISLGIDELLARDVVTAAAGRMGINTAACLALLGTALALGAKEAERMAGLIQGLALSAALITLTALVGYLYGVVGLYRVLSSPEMAPGTASLLLVFAVGVLCLFPSRGVVRGLMSGGPGGQLIRRLLPLSAVTIVGSGAMIILVRSRGWLASEFDIATFVVLSVATLVMFTFWTAGVLDRVAAARVLAEAALRDGERRYRRLADATPSIVFAAGLDGRVNYANSRWFEYTGMDPGTPLTQIGRRFIHPDDLPNTVDAWRRCIESGTSYEMEHRLKDRSGHYRWHLVRAVPDRDSSGAIVTWTGTATDIDAQKHADKRKDEFLAMLAHELRNPLAPIVSGVQLLQRRGTDDPDVRASFDAIERQAHHLTRIVDDLLDVSRAAHGKMLLRKAPVRAGEVVTRARESTRGLFDERRHRLEVRVPEQPVWIDGDEVRLTQIVANLLNNAAKFTPEGGCVALTVTENVGVVEIVVSDSGIGIAPDMLRHIFEPFAQVDHTVGRATAGLGVGLTMVQTLAGLHGGTVKAESEGLGRGSRFTVTLPTIVHEAIPATSPEKGVEQATKARVLLVDDNADALLTLSMLLRLEGHEVAVAHEGREALRVASEFRPDVVLLDIGLPGMDGYELGRRMRAEPTTADVVLIAVTGYSHTEARRRSKEMGFDQHLVKPVDPAALVRSLVELPSRRSMTALGQGQGHA